MLQKIRLEQKLDEIVKTLEAKKSQTKHLGVLAGSTGISLFFFYYARYAGSNRHAQLANDMLSECFEKINEGYSFPTYCAGLAGMGWAFEHMAQQGFIDIDNDELLPELEPYLYTKMRQELAEGHYDFLHGALGYGLYFLKRFTHTRSTGLKAKYSMYLHELLEGLKASSEEDAKGIKWSSQFTAKNRSAIVYNLSLSHGISSIVNFLSRLYEHAEFRAAAWPLIKGSIDYLQAQEMVIGDCLFPSSIFKEPGIAPVPTRLAWCYGDLGLGLSLYRAAKVLEDPKLEKDALRILLHNTQRKDLKTAGVVDASPCHGAFGIAQIFGTLYRQSGLMPFKEATDYWMQAGLDMAVYPSGYAGYKQHTSDNKTFNEVNLLEGIAGIGLVIIGYLSQFDTSWEESLLIK